MSWLFRAESPDRRQVLASPAHEGSPGTAEAVPVQRHRRLHSPAGGTGQLPDHAAGQRPLPAPDQTVISLLHSRKSRPTTARSSPMSSFPTCGSHIPFQRALGAMGIRHKLIPVGRAPAQQRGGTLSPHPQRGVPQFPVLWQARGPRELAIRHKLIPVGRAPAQQRGGTLSPHPQRGVPQFPVLWQARGPRELAIRRWINFYNSQRPQSALQWSTPLHKLHSFDIY